MKKTINIILKGIGALALIIGLCAVNKERKKGYLTVTQAVVNNDHDTITNYLQCDTIPQHILRAIKSYDKVIKAYKDIRFDVLDKIPKNGVKITIQDPALKQSHKSVYVYYRDKNHVFQETLEIKDENMIYTMTYDKKDNPYICEIKNLKTNVTYTIYYAGSLNHKTIFM